jgi:hypothetical protein
MKNQNSISIKEEIINYRTLNIPSKDAIAESYIYNDSHSNGYNAYIE